MPNLRKFYNLTPENVMGLKLQPPKRYLYTPLNFGMEVLILFQCKIELLRLHRRQLP